MAEYSCGNVQGFFSGSIFPSPIEYQVDKCAAITPGPTLELRIPKML